jgi:programmed cell death protein 4
MIGKGFERLFEIVDEIEIDAPNAPHILSSFIARAVIDEILPPSFLSDSVVRNLGGDIIESAKIMLSQDHAGAKLEKIWGPGDGRPVEEMKVAVDQLLLEYVLSADLDEAVRCLRELNALQFFHEVVKRGIVLALDKEVESQVSVSKLFAHLSSINLLSSTQALKGFNRVLEILPDISLDAPHAKSIVDGFVQRAKEDGILPKEFGLAAPSS